MAIEQNENMANLIAASAKSTIANYVDSPVRRDAERDEKSIWRRFRYVRTKKGIANGLNKIGEDYHLDLKALVNKISPGTPFEDGETVCLIEEIGEKDTPTLHRIDEITDGRVANISSSTTIPTEIKEGTILNYTQNGVPVSELISYKTFLELKFTITAIVKEKYERGLKNSRHSYYESLLYTRKGLLYSMLRLAGRIISSNRYKEIVTTAENILTSAKARLLDRLTLLKLIDDRKLQITEVGASVHTIFVIGVNLGREIVKSDLLNLNYVLKKTVSYTFPEVKYSGVIIVEVDKYHVLKASIETGMEKHREKLRSALIKELSYLLGK